MIPRHPARILSPLALAILASAALAYTDPPASSPPASTPPASTPPARSPSPADAPPALAGPTIAPAGSVLTLVERRYDGSLVLLETRPEVAAVERMPLAADSRTRVEKVLADRAAVLDAIVARSIPLLTELNSASQAGDQYETLRLWMSFSERLAPLRAMGRLEEQIAAVLDPAEAEAFTSLVAEYRDALVEDARARADDPRKIRRFTVLAEETRRQIGQEVARSVERQFDDGDRRLEDALAAVEATPEQEARIRALVDDYVGRTILRGERPTKAQETAMGLGILNVLNPEQRLLFLRLQRQQDRP